MYALRILVQQPVRFALTVGGIALCVMLMLFLLSIYRGVAAGSVEYIRRNPSDLWVLQRNATNILRGSSILTTAHGAYLGQVPEVEAASPVLLILSTVRRERGQATLFLVGYDPVAGSGGPPEIVAGRGVMADTEIVLDRSFARKHGILPGEFVCVQDDSLCVVGLSGGTNAFVIQYGFASIARVRSLIGFPSMVTCYCVRLRPGTAIDSMRTALVDDLPGIVVFDQETFLNNNVREMESGFLPILYAIAAIGAIVLTSILTLLLTVIILESRKDFAVMRALGSPDRFIHSVILAQAMLLACCGTVVAMALFPPMASVIEWLTPEVSTAASATQIGSVTAVVLVVTSISAWIAIRRVKPIYPLEAFA
jgi:putative ABC transport system permease protein